MTIVLHQVGPAFGASSMSPFCIKLECWLRMAELPYTARVADFRKAPKGKVPFVEIEGRYVGDSQLIIDALVTKHGDVVDSTLTTAQRAEAHTIRRMLEEGTYFVGLYARWIDDDGWRVFGPTFRAAVPAPIRPFVPLLRRRVRNVLHAQGTLRHSHDEIYALGARDADVLATRLGDGAYFYGDQPTSLDATVYAFLEAWMCLPYASGIQKAAKSHPNLVAYRGRMRERFFPELGASAR